MNPFRLLLFATYLLIAAAPSSLRAQPGNTLRVERPDIGRTENIQLWYFGEVPYVTARDVARLTGATLRWRADVGKLVLRNSRHSLKFTTGLRYVVIDDGETVQMANPVRHEVGEIYVPLATFETLLPERFVRRADISPGRLELLVEAPNTGRPVLKLDQGVTRFTLPLHAPLTASLVSSRASRFTVRVPGARLGAIPGDTLQRVGLIKQLRFRRRPDGLQIDLKLNRGAASYRLRRLESPPRIDLEVSPSPGRAGFVDVAPEFGPHAGRVFRVLVIDAGHGGADSGYVAAGMREKDLNLALAAAVRDALLRTLPDLRVILTRTHDLYLPAPRRAEVANRVHADLFLSLHFDGAPRTMHGGITAYVAPPLDVSREVRIGGEQPAVRGLPRARPVSMIRWREAAGKHHPEARTAAEHLLASLASEGYGPSRLRVANTYPTEGVDCPAVMLECGTLSRQSERSRLAGATELRRLAGAIARALARYVEGEPWP